MYTESIIKDGVLFFKAFLSNQIARLTPKLYVNLTQQTGRGSEDTSVSDIASYFIKCFDDYRDQLNFNNEEFCEYLKNKVVLEYGPGDILGVAFLLYAYGAERVTCVDRFPLSKMTEKNIKVYKLLQNSLDSEVCKRANKVFNKEGDPSSGFNENIINYQVMENGLSGAIDEYDLVISRAVLEHVNDLEKIMLDIKCSMKNKGVSIHQVDLKSHGLDRYIEFDFLTWPRSLYKLMYSHKGFPNRVRVDTYKENAKNMGLNVKRITSIGKIDKKTIDFLYPKLDKDFINTSKEELSWKGFWVHFEK